jgi:hypothetical protein
MAKRCDRLGLRCVGEPGKCEEKRGEEWGEEGKENASKTSSGGKKKANFKLELRVWLTTPT